MKTLKRKLFYMNFKLKILPAYKGDSILLTYGDKETNILIDTGTKTTYTKGALKKLIIEHDNIDLLILTHLDEDHIGGIIKYFEDKNRKQSVFKKVWFNTHSCIGEFLNTQIDESKCISISDSDNLEMSFKQGLTLESMLESCGILTNRLIKALDVIFLNEAKLTILSPEIKDLANLHAKWEIEKNEDLNMSYSNDYNLSIDDLVKNEYTDTNSIQNKSSIAFMIEYSTHSVLFMADASPTIIENSLRNLGYHEDNILKLSVLKLAHHGSKNCFSPSLLRIINCDKYIISTDNSNGLPSKESLSRIITSQARNVKFYFNYKNDSIKSIFSEKEMDIYGFEVLYLCENNYIMDLDE